MPKHTQNHIDNALRDKNDNREGFDAFISDRADELESKPQKSRKTKVAVGAAAGVLVIGAVLGLTNKTSAVAGRGHGEVGTSFSPSTPNIAPPTVAEKLPGQEAAEALAQKFTDQANTILTARKANAETQTQSTETQPQTMEMNVLNGAIMPGGTSSTSVSHIREPKLPAGFVDPILLSGSVTDNVLSADAWFGFEQNQTNGAVEVIAKKYEPSMYIFVPNVATNYEKPIFENMDVQPEEKSDGVTQLVGYLEDGTGLVYNDDKSSITPGGVVIQ